MNEELTGDDESAAQYVAPVTGQTEARSLAFQGKQTFEEAPLSEEESLSKFQEMFENSEHLALVTDLDGTVLPFAENPMDCKIDPVAKAAMEKLSEAGIPVIVMTGRSGADGAKMIEIPDATVIGTAGWEVYKDGVSHVHEKFNPFSEELANLLRQIREATMVEIGYDASQYEPDSITSELPSPDGPVVLERKAVNERFPEGLSQTYNLNRVTSNRWAEIVEMARRIFEESASDGLKAVFKFEPSESINLESKTCGFSVSPYAGEGKEKSLIQVLRSDSDINPRTNEPKRHEYFRGVEGGFDGVIFLGDSDQDARALRATHLTAVIAGRRSAGVVVAKSEVVGSGGQQRAVKNADVAVEGIEGNGRLLRRIAELCDRYYRTENH